MKLKIEVEEENKIQESLRGQLDENDLIIKWFEVEKVTLVKDLQKKEMQQNNTRILDNIINIQIPYNDRSGLGYNKIEKEKYSRSKMT
jgi:hypothetical protein